MIYKTGKRQYNPALKSEIGLTTSSEFTSTPTINYSIRPTPDTVVAKFSGLLAKCGNCGHGLGEFVRVDGRIKCKESDCKTMNIVKK